MQEVNCSRVLALSATVMTVLHSTCSAKRVLGESLLHFARTNALFRCLNACMRCNVALNLEQRAGTKQQQEQCT